jgi:chromosome partitioning protein
MSATRVIVVANEKGGSGKSTVAMHIAVALVRAGQRVATIDLDTRQRTFTHYVENRRDWARRTGRDLPMPDHFRFGNVNQPTAQDASAGRKALTETIGTLGRSHGVVVIDTPGHDSYLMRQAHMLADTLVTPLNDSFVDLDVLGSVDPESFRVAGISHYAVMVQEAQRQREIDHATIDWIVLRNRLSALGSRNKRLVGEGLAELSLRLGFRHLEGLAERMIFRELFPRGLTAVDDIDEVTLGTRPTVSHVTARLEMQNLLAGLFLGSEFPVIGKATGGSRSAA